SLMEGHRLGRLRVEHDSVVADGPTEIGTGAPDLLADEAIFDGDDVMREGLLVEDVPELAVERAPLVVANLEQTCLDPERVADVLTERVARELDGPVIQVGAVEELNPFFLMRLTRLQAAGRIVLRPTGRDEKRDRQGGGCEWTVEWFRSGCRQRWHRQAAVLGRSPGDDTAATRSRVTWYDWRGAKAATGADSRKCGLGLLCRRARPNTLSPSRHVLVPFN